MTDSSRHPPSSGGPQRPKLPSAVANELRAAMASLAGPDCDRLASLAEEILPLSAVAAAEFLKICPTVIGRAGMAGLESWCRGGIEVLRNSEDGGVAYFRLGTSNSVLLLDELCSGVELSGVRDILQTYCLALTGEKACLLPVSGDWQAEDMNAEVRTADGHCVLVPRFVDRYDTKSRNFAWYKIMATHQMGHIEFGNDGFRPADAADLCRRLRLPHSPGATAPGSLVGLLKTFDNRRLARDIAAIVEDARIDHQIRHRYRGISGTFREAQHEALDARPSLKSRRLRDALLEVLVQMGLGRTGKWQAPEPLCMALRLGARIMKPVIAPDATAADGAAATIRLYQLARAVPNSPMPSDGWAEVDPDAPHDDVPVRMDDVDRLLADLPCHDADSHQHVRPPDVEFRGLSPPDLAPGGSDSESSDEEETTASPSGQPSADQAGDEDLTEIGTLAIDESYEEGVLVAPENETNQGVIMQILDVPDPRDADNASDNALEADGPDSFLYDEWDFRANDYRLRWCRVRQVTLDEGTPQFFEDTLEEYAELVSLIQRRFEMLNPQLRRRVKRLEDGDELDLDAVIDSVTGRKAGQSPDGRVFSRRDKQDRDISVAFLLDMSSSTIEYIGRKQLEALGQNLFRDYKDYFEWLQSGESSRVRPQAYKRIIDLERESTVLLIRAMEAIGDTYAIYGFSGRGRENVEFYVIKDIDEQFSDRIKGRIDSVAPKYGTRMGPAIRHATHKLEKQDASSKLLFLISDGRPEDYGYGRHGLERDYAVHDTRMALQEAKWKGVTPFCLTFDRDGHDYLRTMCGDMRYEVLADVERLPECLPALYERFTA